MSVDGAKQCGQTLRGNWLTADEQQGEQRHQCIPPSWHLHDIIAQIKQISDKGDCSKCLYSFR